MKIVVSKKLIYGVFVANTENEKKAMELAEEMQKILEHWLGKDGPECDAAMRRAASIKKEINAFGFFVDWTAGTKPDSDSNPDTSLFKVEVIVSKPKPNMTPEEQLIYDIWFKKMNGLM